jgi:hypothetical protein
MEGILAYPLTDGEARRRLLDTLAKDLGNPIAIKLTGNEYAEYRTNALKAGANPKTLNNRLGYLRSVFNVLHQLGEIDYSVVSTRESTGRSTRTSSRISVQIRTIKQLELAQAIAPKAVKVRNKGGVAVAIDSLAGV